MSENQDNVYPRPKKMEDNARVPKSTYKDYDKNWVSDKQDGKNPANLNSKD